MTWFYTNIQHEKTSHHDLWLAQNHSFFVHTNFYVKFSLDWVNEKCIHLTTMITFFTLSFHFTFGKLKRNQKCHHAQRYTYFANFEFKQKHNAAKNKTQNVHNFSTTFNAPLINMKISFIYWLIDFIFDVFVSLKVKSR